MHLPIARDQRPDPSHAPSSHSPPASAGQEAVFDPLPRVWQTANGRRRSVALDTLRKGAGRLFGMILMGMLVFSFGIWGIADIFRGYGRQTLIRVGDTEINSQDYMRAQQDVLRAMSSQAGRSLSLQ